MRSPGPGKPRRSTGLGGGTERRPVGWNRSANKSGGNNRVRSRARNRYTEPSGSAASHQRAPTVGSSGRRSWRPRVTTTSSGSDDKTRSLPAQQLMDEPDTDQQPPSGPALVEPQRLDQIVVGAVHPSGRGSTDMRVTFA